MRVCYVMTSDLQSSKSKGMAQMKRISFNRKVNRKRKSLIVFAAAAAVGLAFMLGSGVAHGQDNASGPGAEFGQWGRSWREWRRTA